MGTAVNQSGTRSSTQSTQVKVSVDPEIASAFKKACAAAKVSMAAELSRFMDDYANGSVKRKAAPNYSTRRSRRTVIKAMLKELEQIRVCEERVRDNTPDNLQYSSAYEATEATISALDEAIDALSGF